jgi:hypothetical protein
MNMIEIGRLLRANTTGCVVGCRVSQETIPVFGEFVRIPLSDSYQVFGIVHDVQIEDDGLVRQLVTAGNVSEEVILDNRMNRNVPLELSVLFTGYEQDGRVYHLLPPRPPLSLDAIYACSPQELCTFTRAGHFGYFRHILRASDLPVGEMIAAHLQQTNTAQCGLGNTVWALEATRELITLLRDDYPLLMSVLSALADAGIAEADDVR